jgi:hypothetical protein
MSQLVMPLRLETSRERDLEPVLLTPTINDDDVIKISLHIKVIDNEVLMVPERYQVEELIERGRSFVLFRAIDVANGQNVAIKKRSKIFPTGLAEEMLGSEQNVDEKFVRIPRRVLREVSN